MRDHIRQCIDPLEEKILQLEEGRPTANDVAHVLEALGLTHLKLASAQVISLLDMLADGITPVNEPIITALLRLCEANKKFLYALAGVLEAPRAAAVLPVPAEAKAEPEAPKAAPAEPAPGQPDHAAADDAEKHAEKALAASKQGITSIRVPTERLDSLIELVGKLMVTFAVLSQSGMRGATLSASTLAELDTVITGLQTQVDAIRLVPLKQIFLPMRLVIDAVEFFVRNQYAIINISSISTYQGIVRVEGGRAVRPAAVVFRPVLPKPGPGRTRANEQHTTGHKQDSVNAPHEVSLLAVLGELFFRFSS